jgi:hypothetical protein
VGVEVVARIRSLSSLVLQRVMRVEKMDILRMRGDAGAGLDCKISFFSFTLFFSFC